MPEVKPDKTTIRLIATRDFRNTHPKSIIVEDAAHADHVHKGAEFELNLKQDRDLIALLNASGSIIDAEDSDSVSRLNKEIAEDRKRNEADAKALADAQKNNTAVLGQILALLQAGALASAKAGK
jgi:hypothetical protein